MSYAPHPSNAAVSFVSAVPSLPSLTKVMPQGHSRIYRLVDSRGEPHPILDDLYDSLESAWSEAERWWNNQEHAAWESFSIGVEVSTNNGDWRTIRYPGS